jgi:hypothetical protein
LVEPILYHNQEDIMSLYGVVVAGALAVGQSLEIRKQKLIAWSFSVWVRSGKKPARGRNRLNSTKRL